MIGSFRGRGEPDSQHHQALLEAVVQVALNSTPLRVRCEYQSGSRSRQVVDCALQLRAELTASECGEGAGRPRVDFAKVPFEPMELIHNLPNWEGTEFDREG